MTSRYEWAQRMMSRKAKMEDYEGDEMEQAVEPELGSHDEPIFYANDRKEKGYFLEGETQPRSKGSALSIIVSELQCPFHGTMRYNGIGFSKAILCWRRDGYWTSDDVDMQLEEANTIFKGPIPDASASLCLINHQTIMLSQLMPLTYAKSLQRHWHRVKRKMVAIFNDVDVSLAYPLKH